MNTTHTIEETTARRARAVLYLRVSTKEQAERGGAAEGFSIPAQREACLRKASAMGADVVEEFVDRGESAKSADRPELQRMLRYVRDDPVHYVIVHKVDRLARNRTDDVLINMDLKTAGANLVSCTENIDETPSGLLLHGIMSSIAEFYSRNLANEVIKGSVEKAKRGGTVGRAPTGYLNVRTWVNGTEIRTVEVDQVRGPLMANAFTEYSTGRWTLRTLLSDLTSRGLDSPPSARRPSRPLTVSNFHRLLRHPYYKGLVRYRGVEYPGSHPPLVDAKTWSRVQGELEAHALSGEKQREHHHYLKGSVFCGRCGSRLIVSMATGRRGVTYPYFVCLGRQRRNGCSNSAMRIEMVEHRVEQHYADMKPLAELADFLRDQLREELRAMRAFSTHDLAVVTRRVRQLEDERQKLLDAYYASAIPLDLLRAEQQRITHDLEAASNRQQMLSASYERAEWNIDTALSFVHDWHANYLAAQPKIRRLLNQAVFEKLFIDDEGHMTHLLAKPFDQLLVTAKPFADVGASRTNPYTTTGDDAIRNFFDLTNNADDEGSNNDCLVGAEGLEPPTTSL